MPVHTDAWRDGRGYMPVHYFATSARLGGLTGLQHLCRAAEVRGIACGLDVVVNHMDSNSTLFRWDGSHVAEPGLQPSTCPVNDWKVPMLCPQGSYFYQDNRAYTPWGPRPDFSKVGVRDYLLKYIHMLMHLGGIRSFRFDSVGCIRLHAEGTNDCWAQGAQPNPDGMQVSRPCSVLCTSSWPPTDPYGALLVQPRVVLCRTAL